MSQVLNLRQKRGEKKPEKLIPDQETGKQPISAQSSAVTDKKLVLVVGLVFILIGVLFLFWQKSVITAVFFFVTVAVMWLTAFKSKKPLRWELSAFGLTVDSFPYRYQDLHSFWIEYQPGYCKELSIRSKKWYHPYIKLPLGQENPLKIREFLLQYLPEERHEDTLVELISRKLGV